MQIVESLSKFYALSELSNSINPGNSNLHGQYSQQLPQSQL